MDKDLIRRRFARMLDQYNKMAVVQKEIADRLAQELEVLLAEGKISQSDIRCGNSRTIADLSDDNSMNGYDLDLQQPKTQKKIDYKENKCDVRGLEVGAGTGFMTKHLLELYPDCRWYVNDISHESGRYVRELSEKNIDFIEADGETLELGVNAFDIVASTSALQWFRDLRDFFSRVLISLKPGGVLAFSTFGPQNFIEITTTTGNSLCYFTRFELEKMLTDLGFEIVSGYEWLRVLEFNSPLEVLHHIKSTGVNAISSQKWTHSRLQEFEKLYREMYNPISLTFHPIIIVARKK